MNGAFNASVQAQINGASTAPIAGPTSTPAASPSGFSTTMSQPKTTASSSLNSAASNSNSTSGAERLLIPGSISLAGFAAFALTFAVWVSFLIWIWIWILFDQSSGHFYIHAGFLILTCAYYCWPLVTIWSVLLPTLVVCLAHYLLHLSFNINDSYLIYATLRMSTCQCR